jgi:hypothetical protein
MKVWWSNLIGLLAAGLLPLQMAICVCQGSGHSHASSHASATENHVQDHGGQDVTPPQHATNKSYERHSDRNEHPGDHSHSHHKHDGALPLGHEPTDGHDCGGHSGGDGHRCECAPQDVLMLQGQSGVSLNSFASDSAKWLSHSAPAFVDTSHNTCTRLLRFWSARSPVTASQGKLCALFCRWLI